MKTVHELNQKWWYRLTKVIFIGTEVLVLVVVIGLIVEQYEPRFDDENSYVYCNSGGFSGFRPKDVGASVYGDYISSFDDRDFRMLCNPTVIKKADGTLMVKRGEPTPEKNYTFTAKYTSRDWTNTLLYSAVAIIVVLFIFELLRRIFYYIVLGSIRPRETTKASSG